MINNQLGHFESKVKSNDVEDNIDAFNEVTQNKIFNNIPKKQIRKHDYLLWYAKIIISLIKQKEKKNKINGKCSIKISINHMTNLKY